MVIARCVALIQVHVDMMPGCELHCGKQSTWNMEDKLNFKSNSWNYYC
jgi:hypothetical protein